jgi:acetylornithine/succinyldiaminopimelate/putrescine aminotransferase
MSVISQRQLFLSLVAQTSDLPLLGVDINIQSARGSILTDVHQKRYIDFISGISVSNVGHCHPKVTEAIKKQADTYMHLMVYGEFNQRPQVAYAKLLSELLPAELHNIYFTTGGSEAIEGAMKLAKRSTGRSEIISFRNAYHGSTQGALSLMSDEYFKNAFRPLLPGIRYLDYNQLSQINEITNTTAAVFAEVVQGEAGVRSGDSQFLKALKSRCRQTGALLVFDEIQTGFGRTGKLFAFEHHEVTPDILCVAKGMGGGLPVGAFIAGRDLMSQLSHQPILGHINTFGGNAVTLAAAKAALEVIIDEKLADRALQIEKIIKNRLKHPLIKELRITGALGAIEFGHQALSFGICKTLIENGLITDWFLFCPTALRIAPPLTISEAELEEACSIILKVLDQH